MFYGVTAGGDVVTSPVEPASCIVVFSSGSPERDYHDAIDYVNVMFQGESTAMIPDEYKDERSPFASDDMVSAILYLSGQLKTHAEQTDPHARLAIGNRVYDPSYIAYCEFAGGGPFKATVLLHFWDGEEAIYQEGTAEYADCARLYGPLLLKAS